MMGKITFYPLILITFYCFKIQAQTPPENDLCVNAIELILGEPLSVATNSLKIEVDYSNFKPSIYLVKTLSNKQFKAFKVVKNN
ncbi:hypothetical protein [Tenacibaculum aquimarinum]|uniref:hypothetical protein n=1 Tax=Tenacibaculum aquimarinum TaxID=2910675 RepID=UPI001F0B3CB1|nr:hypothetical protein [Tenacibaculum aquimarinum]MCH3885779.1 hypothetical protein [Tenacibaculum aquimarinum]